MPVVLGAYSHPGVAMQAQLVRFGGMKVVILAGM